jgi:Tol biopolymer transport system component
MIAPDKQHFIFLHRWISKGIKYDALFSAHKDGQDLKCLADDGMVSHCFWMNNTEIIAYMRDNVNGDKYYKINIQSGEREIFGDRVINSYGDGHPSVHGSRILFDTYPDRSRMKSLFIYDSQNDVLDKAGEFFEPMSYAGECRCDLHPRFSPDGKKVFIDSVHEGKRKLYEISLSS